MVGLALTSASSKTHKESKLKQWNQIDAAYITQNAAVSGQRFRCFLLTVTNLASDSDTTSLAKISGIPL